MPPSITSVSVSPLPPYIPNTGSISWTLSPDTNVTSQNFYIVTSWAPMQCAAWLQLGPQQTNITFGSTLPMPWTVAVTASDASGNESSPAIATIPPVPPSTNIVITWPAGRGVVTIQSTTNFLDWRTETNTGGTNATFTTTNFAHQSFRAITTNPPPIILQGAPQ